MPHAVQAALPGCEMTIKRGRGAGIAPAFVSDLRIVAHNGQELL